MKSRKLAVLCGSLLILGCAPAFGSPVYPGCAEPPATSGRSFWVDPIHGSASGDGSRAHPWRTLQEVVTEGLFTTTPQIARRDAASHWLARMGLGALADDRKGAIRPGDTVWLLSGDQGAVTLQGYFGKDDILLGYNNPQFITIAAAPGQTPVLRKLELVGGSKWVFRGLTFESVNNTGEFAAGGSSVKDYWLVSLTGPHSDIIFDSNQLRSATDTHVWSLDDWRRRRASGLYDGGGMCVAITDNALRNVGNGFKTQSSRRVLIENNSIDRFSDDGIDYGSSDLRIAHNRITNSIEDGDGIHRDGMQGQPGKPYTEEAVAENIEISANMVIRVTDPNLEHPGFLQGIDAFDGVWNNLRVTNNVVVTDAGHGISYYGVHGIVVSGNIVLPDNGRLLPCVGIDFKTCLTKKTVTDLSTHPQIVINQSKIRVPSSDVTVIENITNGIRIDQKTVNFTVANNLCVATTVRCTIGIPVGASMVWASSPGAYGRHNVIPSFDAHGLFVRYDPVHARYDLRLTRPNPATGR